MSEVDPLKIQVSVCNCPTVRGLGFSEYLSGVCTKRAAPAARPLMPSLRRNPDLHLPREYFILIEPATGEHGRRARRTRASPIGAAAYLMMVLEIGLGQTARP